VGGDVAQDVAAHVYGVKVFDGRIVVAAFCGLAVVGWRAYSAGGSLIDAVYEDALACVRELRDGNWRFGGHTQMYVWAQAWPTRSERRSAEVGAMMLMVAKMDLRNTKIHNGRIQGNIVDSIYT
jgi:hypothetical protein